MTADLILAAFTLAAALACIWAILRNPDRPYFKEF